MAEVVDLRSRTPTSHDDEFNSELVRDLARFSEGGLITEKEIRRRYKFDEATWNQLGENEALFAAIEDEKTRRVRSGALKRERAQALVTSAPGVLGEILLDKNNSPKHRIDSAKVLDSLAANGPTDNTPAGDRFIITINLGTDTLTFNKSIKPDVNDIDPNHIEDVPQTEWLPVIEVNKKEDDGADTI